MEALKGKELEIDLYLTTKDGKVLEKVLGEREILNPNPRLSTSIEMRMIPPSDYFIFSPNRVNLDLNSLNRYDRGIIYTKNTSGVLIVTYERKRIDLDQMRMYVDPTIIRALNVYSDRKPCYLHITIEADKVSITTPYQPHYSCEKYIIEDREKDVAAVLAPVSLYSAKLTDKERERNFGIRLFPEDFKNDRGESVGLLLKITRI
jgi:hypothetical protein